MCKWLARFVVLMFLGAATLLAQENLVSLAEAVRRVAERDPGIRAREAERQAAQSEARRAETLRLPKMFLSMDAGGGKLVNDVANVLLTGLTPVSVTDPKTRSRLAGLSANRPYLVPGARLESNLFDGGRAGATIRSAWLGESKAGVARDRAREDEAYATASDFLNLAERRISSRYLEEYARVAELAAQALSAQAKAGRITEARALAGQARFQSAQAALENNRDDLRLTSDLLRQRAGFPAQTAFDTPPLEAQLSDFRLALIPGDGDLEKNSDLLNAELDARMQEQQVRSSKAARLPELRFVAEYGFSFSSLLFTFRPGYNVGVRANFPLFTSHETERNIQSNLRKLDAASLKEEKVKSTLREEYARLLADNRKLGRQLEAARSQLAQAEELYRVSRLKYDQGAGSPADLLEAAELLLNTRERCLELARSSLELRWTALRLQGGLLAELERAAQP
jgi:outer membrane protein TolC